MLAGTWHLATIPETDIIAFEVKDLDMVYEKVWQAGVKTVALVQRRPNGRGCFKCYDPERNVVEFLGPPP